MLEGCDICYACEFLDLLPDLSSSNSIATRHSSNKFGSVLAAHSFGRQRVCYILFSLSPDIVRHRPKGRSCVPTVASVQRPSGCRASSHDECLCLRVVVTVGALVNESNLPRTIHHSIFVSAVFHQAQHSHRQEGEYPDTSKESMFIHLLLRLSIPFLQVFHPILRHLRNIENCRCTVLCQIYCIFIHLYYLFQTISF